MNRILTLTLGVLLCGTAWAQSGVLEVHPASNPDGKLLSMKDVTYGSRAVYPASKYFTWNEDGSYGEYKPGSAKPAAAPALPKSDDPEISYGVSVSRDEFGISKGVFPSNDGKLNAVYRKDEHDVTNFPLLDITTRTGSLLNIKYPMNGMPSEHIALCVCDLEGKILSTMDVTDFDDERYLTNITWSPDDKYIFIQVLDRSQHHMHLNMYRAADGKFVRTILTEDNDAWTEPLDELYFMKGSYKFIYRTDNRDGYRNLYLCDTLGTIQRVTKVDADVAYVANDGRYIYYTSAEVSPAENHLFRIDTKKKKAVPARLTPEAGWHNISMSPNCSKFIDTYSSINVPRVINARKADGTLIENLFKADDPLAEYAQCEVDFGTVKSADGQFDNFYRLYKPLGFDPSKKYPLIVYVYGGPHSQMVNSSWLGQVRMWEMLMAQKGYVVYVQDNRGTQNHGAAYEKAINRQCGQAEMADQMEGIKMLFNEPWIDQTRVGVHGWSYGGFMTTTLITNHPEVFKVAVAGGPVIDWKWYEVMYGERYMDTEATNPEGFAKTSLINKAADLKGKLLICQGAIDKTVVWEHSLSFIQKCIENNVKVDYFPYPCTEHNVAGTWREHLMQKVTDYFEDYL